MFMKVFRVTIIKTRPNIFFTFLPYLYITLKTHIPTIISPQKPISPTSLHRSLYLEIHLHNKKSTFTFLPHLTLLQKLTSYHHFSTSKTHLPTITSTNFMFKNLLKKYNEKPTFFTFSPYLLLSSKTHLSTIISPEPHLLTSPHVSFLYWETH